MERPGSERRWRESKRRVGSDKGRELRGAEGKRSIFCGAYKEVGIYEE